MPEINEETIECREVDRRHRSGLDENSVGVEKFDHTVWNNLTILKGDLEDESPSVQSTDSKCSRKPSKGVAFLTPLKVADAIP